MIGYIVALWVRIRWLRVILNPTLRDKFWPLLVTGWWFSSGTFEYSTNVTDCHNITEILLKMAWSNSEIVYMYLIFFTSVRERSVDFTLHLFQPMFYTVSPSYKATPKKGHPYQSIVQMHWRGSTIILNGSP